MTENSQPDDHQHNAAKGGDALHPQQNADGQRQFTPEELRKAARVQVILYIVMAVFIVLPFVFMWLRKN